jgi:hypothetical protein
MEADGGENADDFIGTQQQQVPSNQVGRLVTSYYINLSGKPDTIAKTTEELVERQIRGP